MGWGVVCGHRGCGVGVPTLCGNEKNTREQHEIRDFPEAVRGE